MGDGFAEFWVGGDRSRKRIEDACRVFSHESGVGGAVGRGPVEDGARPCNGEECVAEIRCVVVQRKTGRFADRAQRFRAFDRGVRSESASVRLSELRGTRHDRGDRA